MLSGDLGYMDTKLVKSIIGKTNEVEGMLKSLMKSVGNKHLNPRILGPSSQTKLEKNYTF